ncbi:MAG: [protein-PII] uridylyltransferase, partial [Dehalococcoidia bacterium]|nr:[protein-PII] uridylyltransferase [Dehalococcoidia bacterium]
MEDSNRVSLVKTLLLESNGVLRNYHLGGAPSQDIVTAHAWFVDQVIKAIWEHHAPSAEKGRSVALIAVGGYGRSELHPGSDIDLLVLFQKAPTKTQRQNTESLIRTLWDVGLTIGHSVRTLRDCTSQSRNDVTVMTNLLESRVLAGDAELLSQLKLQTGVDLMWPAAKYLEAKIEEQSARHLRYDDTAYNLEPQIKEGPGGLRDLQTIGWVAHRVLSQQGLRYLISYNYLTEHEYRDLIRGRNFLWKIRTALHFASGRAEDRLLFDY